MAQKSDNVYGLLCFLSTALDKIDDERLKSECLQYYSTDAITNAKKKLWNKAPDEVKDKAKSEEGVTKIRKGDEKNTRNVSDILILFKKYNELGKRLPRFHANTYDAMPPIMMTQQIDNLAEEVNELNI